MPLVNVQWKGRKSKRSNVLGSGGYSAEAYSGCELHVEEFGETWTFTVNLTRVGAATSRQQAQEMALDLANRLAKVPNV